MVKVPLIFYNKDIIPVGESEYQIRQIDIFPTIIDLIVIKYNIKVTGENALPIIKEEESEQRDAYIEPGGSSFQIKMSCLQELGSIIIINSFIYHLDKILKELYRLDKDPEEKQKRKKPTRS